MRRLGSCRVTLERGRGAGVCPYYRKQCFCLSKMLTGLLCRLFCCFFFLPLFPFFLTPLSHCVALYHGAGLAPETPSAIMASWLTPPPAAHDHILPAGAPGLLKVPQPVELDWCFRDGGSWNRSVCRSCIHLAPQSSFLEVNCGCLLREDSPASLHRFSDTVPC